jgi:hypothetical protein
MSISRLRVLAVTALAAPLAFGTTAARAQFAPGHNIPSAAGKPKEAPPDALPGAQTDKARVTPLDKPNTDIPPTEALFDAINRGDITSARDAISRGADLAGKNILGLTPLELSVDLGRNDITFLLLSYRGLDDTTHRAPPQVAESRPGRAGRAAAAREHAADRAAERAERAQAQREAAAARAGARAAAPRTPQLYAGDGGTPVPNAGFLGFDAGRR